MSIDIEQLEQALAGEGGPQAGPDLATIHRLGARRRRVRSAAVAGSTALALAAVVGLGAVVQGNGGSARDDSVAVADAPPDHLSALAERALADIPGAVRVNSGEVVIPAPDALPQMVERVQLDGAPLQLPRDFYNGVTTYARGAFPHWLYDGTAQVEQAAGDDNGYPVGTTDLTGVLVDAGKRYLGCVVPPARWGRADSSCVPSVLTRLPDGKWNYEYGLGTDDFLTAGAPMEVFAEESYVSGGATTLAIAGLDGTDVARAEFVNTAGQRVDGTVAAGTLVPGDSMFFGEVPGELAEVIAYDASGKVIEDHRLKDCDNPVDCEVR